MKSPISDGLFIDYLQCKHKAYLRQSGKIVLSTIGRNIRKVEMKIIVCVRKHIFNIIIKTTQNMRLSDLCNCGRLLVAHRLRRE